jgi:hypothetical protein
LAAAYLEWYEQELRENEFSRIFRWFWLAFGLIWLGVGLLSLLGEGVREAADVG